MSSDTSFSPKGLSLEWISAAVANSFASAVLNPMDVAKTRMQAINNTSMIATIRELYGLNGVAGLWKPGLSASITREWLYSGPRAGFYVPLRDYLQRVEGSAESNETVTSKVIAALITGTESRSAWFGWS